MTKLLDSSLRSGNRACAAFSQPGWLEMKAFERCSADHARGARQRAQCARDTWPKRVKQRADEKKKKKEEDEKEEEEKKKKRTEKQQEPIEEGPAHVSQPWPGTFGCDEEVRKALG